MDTITVVIQLTGLLLLTPDDPSGRGPMHVLMPETRNVESHVALLTFPGDSAEYCLTYVNGRCTVDMDGWSMKLGRKETGTAGRDTLPRSATNLTRISGGKSVSRRLLGERPGRRVRSRITLRAGGVTDSCSMAEWRYTAVGSGRVEIEALANVVDWTIHDVPRNGSLLVRKRLDRVHGDSVEKLAIKYPASGPLEIFISHIPTHEAAMLGLIRSGRDATPPLHAVDERGVSAGTDSVSVMVGADSVATHFNAYYSLLGAKKNERPLPKFERFLRRCSGRLGQRPSIMRAGELSCMVASARTR